MSRVHLIVDETAEFSLEIFGRVLARIADMESRALREMQEMLDLRSELPAIVMREAPDLRDHWDLRPPSGPAAPPARALPLVPHHESPWKGRATFRQKIRNRRCTIGAMQEAWSYERNASA